MPTPVFIELAGLPAAGKTTTASLLQEKLTRRGLRCLVVPEAAGRSPLASLKRNWQFNVWTLCQGVSSVLEHQGRQDKDVVVLDRGLVDALCWMRWFRMRRGIEPMLADAVEAFAKVPTWFQAVRLVVVLRVKFETALKRRGQPGRIVNAETFEELHRAYSSVTKDLTNRTRQEQPRYLDTDGLSRSQVLDEVLSVFDLHFPDLANATRGPHT
jgi:thymidylate kinase